MARRKPRTLLIVETPFQVLCAYEYMRTHDEDVDFFIRHSCVGSNDQQVDAMVAQLRIPVKAVFRVRPRVGRDYLIAIASFLTRGVVRFDKVVRGSYFSGFQRLLSRLVLKRETVLLDDGLATLRADKIISEREPGRYSAFSAFRLNEPAYVRYTLNRFENTARDFHCAATPDFSSFFIGQKLVDLGIIDLPSYLEMLVGVVAHAGERVHYVPHRTESQEIVAAIGEIEGISILRSDVAAEYFILRAHWYPKAVYSVTSTALYTLARMFPQARAFAVRSVSLRTSMIGEYQQIMERFGELGNVSCLEVG